jgi:hypothetical protein
LLDLLEVHPHQLRHRTPAVESRSLTRRRSASEAERALGSPPSHRSNVLDSSNTTQHTSALLETLSSHTEHGRLGINILANWTNDFASVIGSERVVEGEREYPRRYQTCWGLMGAAGWQIDYTWDNALQIQYSEGAAGCCWRGQVPAHRHGEDHNGSDGRDLLPCCVLLSCFWMTECLLLDVSRAFEPFQNGSRAFVHNVSISWTHGVCWNGPGCVGFRMKRSVNSSREPKKIATLS